MNENIIKEISIALGVKYTQVQSALNLLEEGNTIPFIARYRKEATGALDEEQIRSISEAYEYQVNLLKRKEDVIRLIDEKQMLTPELKEKIMAAEKLVEVEDLYRPYKEKKKTKATEAIAMGLKPLAEEIMKFPRQGNMEEIAKKYISEQCNTVEECIAGAKYIIAEDISDNARFRGYIRKNTFLNGNLVSKMKAKAEDEEKVYEMYYAYSEPVKYAKPHRVLALNRGEKDGVLSVSISVDTEGIIRYLEDKVIGKKTSFVVDIVKEAIADSYKRLIAPSIEREIRADITEKATNVAIDVFSKNLEKLLLQPPMKDKMILGLDPAFRTGCKLAVVDKTGKYLEISVIYPHEPKKEYEKSKLQVLKLIDKYGIDIIAIGNGTASRESEAFIADCIKEANRKVEYIIVNEAGASVYSASKLAISEFPDLHVEERSAISIAKRLQDPLSELVKIDSKSIGVGQYQHDVPEKKLDESLDFVVSKAVNLVGVNLNTASRELLKYVSGMTKTNIDKLLKYRDENGKFLSREALKKSKILSEKAYEQAIGFMRVEQGNCELDRTGIHPESYDIANKILESLNLKVTDMGTSKMISALDTLDIEKVAASLNSDKFTVEDIIKALKAPTRDPRDDFEKPLLKSDILKLEDLKVGMKLQGTVRNVVDFGAFIDIGLKSDGLAHISKLTDKYIKHPLEVVSVGDIVDCYVDEIKLDKKKVALSLIEPKFS
ncbi:MAG: RNA-binding transcriptional accessory protein [Clostridia bacterium]|nr:RNA-binding transcriptional accessory protein [Clostridia bacterium]